MARDDPYFRLRIPEALKAKVEAASNASQRSMTAEIISRLERSFDLDDGLTELNDGFTDHEKRIDQLEAQVSGLLERAGLVDYDPD